MTNNLRKTNVMATSVRLIRRYVWLIETIRRAGNISLEEINEKWLDERSLRLEDETIIPERTFHRHRQAIADIFGIDILCNRHNGNTYYIENDDALNGPSFTSWLFNGLAIDNQLRGNTEIARRVMFEPTSGGTEYIPSIIEAMAKNRIVRLTYQRYNFFNDFETDATPLGLKQSGQRWYLLAKLGRNEFVTVLGLDRLESLHITDKTFEPDRAVDVNKYFDEVIGVNVDSDYEPEEVRLRVYGNQRAYVESLPLHKTQQLITKNSEYSDYSLTVRPEYEFQHAVLALGGSTEILSPQWLRDEIKSLVAETLRRYTP